MCPSNNNNLNNNNNNKGKALHLEANLVCGCGGVVILVRFHRLLLNARLFVGGVNA